MFKGSLTCHTKEGVQNQVSTQSNQSTPPSHQTLPPKEVYRPSIFQAHLAPVFRAFWSADFLPPSQFKTDLLQNGRKKSQSGLKFMNISYEISRSKSCVFSSDSHKTPYRIIPSFVMMRPMALIQLAFKQNNHHLQSSSHLLLQSIEHHIHPCSTTFSTPMFSESCKELQ